MSSVASRPSAVPFAAVRAPRPRPEPVHVLVEEDVHLAYSAGRGRHLWEDASFTLRAVLVTGGGRPPRRYAPDERWAEAAPDPRAGYARVAGRLRRFAEAGRDYDPGRHLS